MALDRISLRKHLLVRYYFGIISTLSAVEKSSAEKRSHPLCDYSHPYGIIVLHASLPLPPLGAFLHTTPSCRRCFAQQMRQAVIVFFFPTLPSLFITQKGSKENQPRLFRFADILIHELGGKLSTVPLPRLRAGLGFLTGHGSKGDISRQP